MTRRVVLLDSEVLVVRGDFERILIHEIFHFAWRRLANSSRRSWERVLRAEFAAKVPGELGWSAEWRKAKLKPRDAALRTPGWRRYARESFCDTAAWRFAGLRHHDEFTLAARCRRPRRTWFDATFPPTRQIPI
jgi:hypothetical protein